MHGMLGKGRKGRDRDREKGRLKQRETSDFRCILYFGHRPIYKPQNTKLNYAHRQTDKTYKQQNTQTNKTYINKQTTNKRKADQTVTPG